MCGYKLRPSYAAYMNSSLTFNHVNYVIVRELPWWMFKWWNVRW